MRKGLLTIAGAIVLVGGTAFAQQESNQLGSQVPAKPELSAAVNVPGTARPEEPGNPYAAFSALIGMGVEDETGNSVGEVADVVFDDAGNKLFVVDVAEDASAEQLVAVPFGSGEIDTAAQVVTLSSDTQSDLQALPAFEYADSMISVRTKTEGEAPAQ